MFQNFFKILLTGFWLLFIFTAKAQVLLSDSELDQTEVYTSIEEALENPDAVFQLDLLAADLTELPPEIGKLKRLQRLYLFENQIITIMITAPYYHILSSFLV